MTTNWEFNIPKNGGSSFTWATNNGFFLSLSREGSIPDARWNQLLEVLRTEKISWMLSVSIGTATIDSMQRKSAADLVKGKNIAIAVVVDSAITRGLLTALSWLGVGIKTFAPGQEPDAIKYLKVSAPSEDEILGALEQLKKATAPT